MIWSQRPARGLGALLIAATATALWACGDGSDQLRLVGSVERTQLELVAPASEVILEIPVSRGDHVMRGQRIVNLDATVALAEVARAEASLAGARTAERIAQQELDRATQLRRGNVASQQELERAELSREEARARQRAAGALLDVAHKRVSDLDLHAPADATVDQLPYEVGERVPAGAVVAVLLEDGAPWVRVWIPEPSVALVYPGTRAEIEIDGFEGRGSPFAGFVLDVSREPGFTPHYALTERDRVHLVYEARVEIAEPPRALRPGVPAEVRLHLEPVLRALEPPSGYPTDAASQPQPSAP